MASNITTITKNARIIPFITFLLLQLSTIKSFTSIAVQQRVRHLGTTNQQQQRPPKSPPLFDSSSSCHRKVLLAPLDNNDQSGKSLLPIGETNINRRVALSFFMIPLLQPTISSSPAFAQDSTSSSNTKATIMIRIPNPSTRAGLELSDTTIGSPPRNVVVIKSVFPNGVAFGQNAQPGMIILDYDNAKSVVERIKAGPYPIDLRLYNLAAGGDAIGDLGRPLVSAEDALLAAEKASAEERVASLLSKSGGGGVGGGEGFTTRVVKKAEGSCGIQSRRGDVMEIRYTARVGGKEGYVYDSSDSRGTGTPYMYQLGNGDMIPGVDLGTYDMCPGEIRELDIPAQLGYGARGSKLFEIPGGSRLWWKIELVALNFVREGQNDNGRDELYDGGSGLLPQYQ